MKIVIADDQAHIRKLIEFQLRRFDYELHFANDGTEALTLCREHRPDIAILDIMMPGIDGLTLCRMLKSEDRAPAVIFLSAKSAQSAIEEAREAGGDAYITKPYSERELLEQIRQLSTTG